ncbi:hypothetical protein [Thermococcus thermotolerans]|uniref:hypothetical protein n=1 Tax=Thermococcus thermotolerans TaxID=2969672 RepID=UPI002157B08E|nr:hypothetical protein [Thermococcus thermotolerans]
MEVRYWILIFIFYISAVIVQEEISIWDFIGFLILVLAFMVSQKKRMTQKEPYIIGNSTEIEYLTPKELERRLQNRKRDKGHNL